jgi:hypothetical protein
LPTLLQAHLIFSQRKSQPQKIKRACKPTHKDSANLIKQTFDQRKPLPLTAVWQKWRFSAAQTHLWLIKVWFSASTFVVKIATFAKP